MKKISLLELLDLARSGNAPKAVKYYGVKYYYFEAEKRYMSVSDTNPVNAGIPAHIRRNLIYQIATADDFLEIANGKKCIELIEPILDGIERAYLRSVIKPFRDNVVSIRKYEWVVYDGPRYNLEIHIKSEYGREILRLPIFNPEVKDMYKNMEPDVHYTLGELGV